MGLGDSRYSDLRDLKDLADLVGLANLEGLGSSLRSRLGLGFEVLRGLGGCSSDLGSCIYYVVYRLSGV